MAPVMHSLLHDRHLGSRTVCGSCAGSMTGNCEAVSVREDRFKSFEVRFHEFMNIPRWQRSEKGNLYCDFRGTNVGVFRSNDGKYQPRIADKISERKFSEEMSALRHLFTGLVKLMAAAPRLHED